MDGSVLNATPALERLEGYFLGRFQAMASPCEVLVDTDDEHAARSAIEAAREEALRIERKFSRYRTDNIVHAIHHAAGQPVEVDEETAGLLDYAAACHEISEGRFDITSGVLRRAWTFDGREHTPDPAAIDAARALVGWSRARWRDRVLTLPAGMEIDLGGIGKEYAVDRSAAQAAAVTDAPCLVNFGGDLLASGPRRGGGPWLVGVEDPGAPGSGSVGRLELARGALATSGDARRHVLVGGVRLGHILDPRTGWPVDGAARSVTVLATTCIEAGTLATLAILQGPHAAQFLEEQGVQHWVVR